MADKLPVIPCFHSGKFNERSREKEGGEAWELSCMSKGEANIDGLDVIELCLPALLLPTEEIRDLALCS